MKKLLLTSLSILSFSIVYAQNPASYTAERTDNWSANINLKNPIGYWHLSGPRSYEPNNTFSIFWNNGAYQRYFSILDNGYIGIGTPTPGSIFHVQNGSTAFNWTPTGGTVGIFESSVVNRAFITIVGKSSAESELWFADESRQNSGRLRYEHEADALEFWTDGANRMTLNKSGQVGIGTTSTGSHKLAVEGSIGAREIKVEAGTGWSDFVFYDNYELPTLVEVENHINEKGHLKDIPSADDVKENGINLGEMNAKLLQKVEELTLYLIEQNKEIKELKKEVSTLKNE